MRLSWNEIRDRAAQFANNWRGELYEKSEAQSFYNDFFMIFGVRRRSVAIYEQRVNKLDDRVGFIDLFWPSVLIVEHKSFGRDLTGAFEQAGQYFEALPERDRPEYILVCDFHRFELHDLDSRKTSKFTLDELPEHVEEFGFILGVKRREFKDQDPVNIEAAELVGRLHDTLKAVGYLGHDLERFLVRIVFCLFADDTGIFEPRDIFLEFIESRTSEDGADLGPKLSQLFQVLDTPEFARQSSLDEDLARFPYINGELFKEQLRIPAFDTGMRSCLLDACQFDWSKISPAIFGALFQSVMEPEERRAAGAHYTTEKNILKVIEPLFLDELRTEFLRIKSRKDSRRRNELRKFQEKLRKLQFLDPACGCGNFLIITYRELRVLEVDVLKELIPTKQQDVYADALSLVNVDQFFGIEIIEFPVRIAEAALWMMDHIMNNLLGLEFGQTQVRIPLHISPRIVHGDALEMDWTSVIPPQECSYVFGNPPFVGAKLQTNDQRTQVRRIAELGKTGGTLDYVTAWFIKAGSFIKNSQASIGFVSTNSIIQGEQIGQLWPILSNRFELEIIFGHRTFAWGSDARGKAHVHVVILGLNHKDRTGPVKRLFSYTDINGDAEETHHKVLSPYLFDAQHLNNPNLIVKEEPHPINGMSQLIIGSKPIDGSQYIFNETERVVFLDAEPDAKHFLHPYMGAREFLRGGKRWILALHEASPNILAKLPLVKKRIAAVREYRKASKSASTVKLAETPTLYHVNVIPKTSYLAIPETSSERRDYLPMGWLKPPVIPSNSLRVKENATLIEFALLNSAMHMAWLRYVGGRLESRYRYSIGLVYNTFPLPQNYVDQTKLIPLAQAVLDARNAHPEATLADLYDPDLMPPNLRRAHQNLDRYVDRLYRRSGFSSERERIEYLFSFYEKLCSPVTASIKKKRNRRTNPKKR